MCKQRKEEYLAECWAAFLFLDGQVWAAASVPSKFLYRQNLLWDEEGMTIKEISGLGNKIKVTELE